MENAASDLGLHYLSMSNKNDTMLISVKKRNGNKLKLGISRLKKKENERKTKVFARIEPWTPRLHLRSYERSTL